MTIRSTGPATVMGTRTDMITGTITVTIATKAMPPRMATTTATTTAGRGRATTGMRGTTFTAT